MPRQPWSTSKESSPTFQMLKYFPGPLEPVATMIIPGLVIGFLAMLPFLDRADGRHPLHGPRRIFTALMVVIGIGVAGLTLIGMADRARSVGGRVETGQDGEDFVVRAWLPTTASPVPAAGAGRS